MTELPNKSVLSFDSGAARMGWASVGLAAGLYQMQVPYYHMSGVLPLEREGKKFQEYRKDLIAELCESIPVLFDFVNPDEIVNETIPAVGGGNFVAAAQSYLANTAITVVQTLATQAGIPWRQIGATTVQAQIAIGRRKGSKTTKVMVRNGVIAYLPELEPRKSNWVKIFDEPDAIAVGLAALGLDRRKVK